MLFFSANLRVKGTSVLFGPCLGAVTEMDNSLNAVGKARMMKVADLVSVTSKPFAFAPVPEKVTVVISLLLVAVGQL